MGTALPLAIEISTREQGLTYSIDSSLVIHVKRSGTYTEEGNPVTQPTVQVKYNGPSIKRNIMISGKITDFATGEALPFAVIQIDRSPIGTTANSEGQFTLLDVPSDTSAVLISYTGYKSATYYLNPSLEFNDLLVEMVPADNSIDEVIIIANREDVMRASTEQLGMVKMSPKKLAELPNVGEKDMMRGFQLMPGVSAANESSSGLYVRGGTPDQNLVTYDGFTIYHVDHLYGFFSAFNANALKDVQLYKGGFDAKFGGRLSSVMEITGKEGNQKQFNFGGDISLLSGNIFTEIPVSEKITLLAAWRRSWKGPIYNWIFSSFNQENNDDAQATMPGPGGGRFGNAQAKTTSFFEDINAKLTYRMNNKESISLSYFYSIDKLDNSFNFSAPSFGGNNNNNFSNGTTDLTRYGNLGTSLKWSRKWNSKLYGNTFLSYSNYYSKRDRSNERTSTDSLGETATVKTGILETNDLVDLSIKSDFEWNAFKGNTIGFGAFATNYSIKYAYSQDDTSTVLDRDDQGVLSGAYLQDRQAFFHSRGEIKGGIRISHFDVTGKFYTEPRFSLSYKLSDRISAKGSYGKYYQFANRITREDILSGSRDFWILSDDSKVPVSSAIHYLSGISYETSGYLFSAEAYYKQLYDISEYSLRFTSSFRNVSYAENFYTGHGYAKGIELLAQKKTGKLTGWVSYTLGQARNQFDVYGTDYFPANQDVSHEFKAVSIYKYKRWDFSATWIYATGRPYTAPGGSYTIELLDGTTKDYFTVTSKNSLRLPDYHRLDVAVNYHILSEKKNDIGYIGLSLFNAYNKTNVWYKQYYISENQVLETNVNYLGITPNLTLSLKIR